MAETLGHGAAPYTLAIDFGTSYTVTAVRVEGRRAELIEIDGHRRLPSVVLVTDEGQVLVGQTAEELAAANPANALRAPKARLGEPSPAVLAGRPHAVVDLVGAVLAHVHAAAAGMMGGPPLEVRLTHPATWGRPRLAQLVEAASRAGIANAVLVPEPVAAALAYAEEVGVPVGGHVAVYDLGGGTFDCTVLRARELGFAVVGRPLGEDRLGGELFDELLANHIGEQLDPLLWEALQISDEGPWRRAASLLRAEARRAKELLSAHPYADVVVALPTGMVQQRVTQDELVGLIEPYIAESVDRLRQCVADAGLGAGDLAAIHLTGGASRTPLVETLVQQAYPGVRVSRRGDPKTAVALGAALAQVTPSMLEASTPAEGLTGAWSAPSGAWPSGHGGPGGRSAPPAFVARSASQPAADTAPPGGGFPAAPAAFAAPLPPAGAVGAPTGAWTAP
ncbi:MAG: Hsp70 family protein, partial [Acidimicrobiales bacterium]